MNKVESRVGLSVQAVGVAFAKGGIIAGQGRG